MSRFRALLATLRIANAPSVVSNVWLGYMVGWLVTPFAIFSQFGSGQWWSAGKISLAGVLLYFAGNLANDWFDRQWDAAHRPERALPSGLFRPATYLVAAVILAEGGTLIAFSEQAACGIWALGIVALIWVYTRCHKRTMWSVIPMGLCRAGLYLLGFLAVWADPEMHHSLPFRWDRVARDWLTIATLASGLFCYIAGLSLSARYEGMENPPPGPRMIARGLIVMPLLAMSCRSMGHSPFFTTIGMIPFAGWLALCLTRYRKPIPRYVSALLAGIPLVDFIAAAPLALNWLQAMQEVAALGGSRDWGFLWHLVVEGSPASDGTVAGGMHLPALLLVPLVAFALGRLLQKVASAT